MVLADDEKLCELLFGLVPSDGTRIGNKKLREIFIRTAQSQLRMKVGEDDYWDRRKQLIAAGQVGKGRGKGGSVYREAPTTKKRGRKKKGKESDLYPGVEEYIETRWVVDNAIEKNQFVLQQTASQGKKSTGGKWTRPDFALVVVSKYPYIPEKTLDLVTFEVKREDQYEIHGVYETAAHSRFSHKSYLLIHAPNGQPETEDFERLKRECLRFGLGLVLFSNSKDGDTYDLIQEAERRAPDPADVNDFISTQFKEKNKTQILKML